MSRRSHVALAGVLLLVLRSSVAAAEAPPSRTDTDPTPARPHPLEFDWTRDGLITGSAAVLWLGSEALFKHELAPPTCRWCDEPLNPVDAWGRGLRAGPRGEQLMDTLSNVVDFGVLPVAMFGTEAYLAFRRGSLEHAAEDALMITQAAVISAVLNQGVKFAVGRQRPFVRELTPEQRQNLRDPADNNLSFYSGHSSFAFSLVVAAGTVAELRGYEGRWAIWAIGLPLATSVPLLRMASDRHYLTDVLTGSIVGAGIGAAVPLLLHSRVTELPVQVSAGPSGMAVSGTF